MQYRSTHSSGFVLLYSISEGRQGRSQDFRKKEARVRLSLQILFNVPCHPYFILQILFNCFYIIESRDYPPSLVRARIGQIWGGGLFAGSLHFRVTTITDHRMPRGHMISVLSLAVWWAKLDKNDKVRHNITHI